MGLQMGSSILPIMGKRGGKTTTQTKAAAAKEAGMKESAWCFS